MTGIVQRPKRLFYAGLTRRCGHVRFGGDIHNQKQGTFHDAMVRVTGSDQEGAVSDATNIRCDRIWIFRIRTTFLGPAAGSPRHRCGKFLDRL
jgi:hypothetical protein